MDESNEIDEDYPSDLIDYSDEFENEDANYDLTENFRNCILPSLTDTFHNFLYTILIVNISLKVILIVNDALSLRIRKEIECSIKILGGLYLIYDFFRDTILIGNYLVLAILFGTLLTFLTDKYHSRSTAKCVWIFCLFVLFSNELLILNGHLRFRRLRAIVMLLFMKFISLFNFLQRDKEKKISFLDCLTYILHPQCLPLGGWNPIYLPNHHFNLISNFWNYLKPFLLSLFFLLCSNCLISYLMSLIENLLLPFIFFNAPSSFYFAFKGLLNAYFVALQFRCSHYFISYTMQYIHYLWDFNVQMTKPLSIEFPRSLVDVVIVWNMPMHEWLKNHLYTSLSFKFGDSRSRFLTFILSSLMHGYDFRIWSVLITLAFLTWIEMRLRKRLSIKLNSCTEARACNYIVYSNNSNWLKELFKSITIQNYSSPNFKCKKHHLKTPFNSLKVNLINLFFSILCIVHLAFLGSAFDGDDNHATFEHVHEIWSFLNYYSLILVVPTFIVYKLI